MSRGEAPVPEARSRRATVATPARAGMARAELAGLIQELTDPMTAAAGELQFALAARLRNAVNDLKKQLRQMMEATK
jgi:excinuclease ABC subunit B